MKTVLRTSCIIAIVTMMGVTAVMAGETETFAIVSPEYGSSAAPVACGNANAVKPIIIAASDSKCPGKVYCNNSNTNCGEYCCEWGYFYSNGCDCLCYRTSSDAGAKCNSYFRCN